MSDFFSMLWGRRWFTDGEIVLIVFTAFACLIILATLVWADRHQDGLRK